MEVYDLKTMKREESVCSPLSIALGNFDGVHAGHKRLVEKAVGYAKEHGCASAIFTFADGAGVLPNKPDVPCITSTEEKLWLMASLGVDYAILEDFDAVRNLSPESFVKELLIKKLGVRCAVCGYNFRFGKGGNGNADTLCELMSPHHCIIVPGVTVEAVPVSSTLIREYIAKGDMTTAAKLLGHPFFFDAEIVSGKKLGRTIGIPTANQYFPDGHIVPKSGIYACKVIIDGNEHIGVANVGTRPTIVLDDHRVNCETHLIGYSGNLYGKKVRTVFYDRLRDEIRFDNIEALRCQIEKDKLEALRCFSKQ